MVQDQTPALLGLVFASQVLKAGMGGIGAGATVVENSLAPAGIAIEDLGNGPGIAGEEKSPLQGQAEGGEIFMMPDRKDAEEQVPMPEAFRDRDRMEDIPKVATSLGEEIGIIRQPALEHGHQLDRDQEAGRFHRAGGRRKLVKEGFQAPDMIQVGMGNEDGGGQTAVGLYIGRQAIGTTVDQQPGLGTPFQDSRGGTQAWGLGITDAQET